MAALARRLSWIPAGGALAILAWRTLGAAAHLGHEIGSIEPARVERALGEPLERRMDQALALPEGSLGAGRDARTLGAKLRRLVVAETEPDAGVFLLLREEPSAFRLYVMLSALLYPRVVAWVPDAAADWMPDRVRSEPLYVLDLEARDGAEWKAHAALVHSDATCVLGRLEAP
jgi:hypothetical protein